MATLKALVDETTNIKNELVTCHSNLKANLVDKGVEVLQTDKMSNLVDKVASIKTGISVVAGDSTKLIIFGDGVESMNGKHISNMSFKSTVNGSIRLNIILPSSSTFYIKKNGAVIYTHNNSSYGWFKYDIDINIGDVISCNTNSTSHTIPQFYYTGDIIK